MGGFVVRKRESQTATSRGADEEVLTIRFARYACRIYLHMENFVFQSGEAYSVRRDAVWR